MTPTFDAFFGLDEIVALLAGIGMDVPPVLIDRAPAILGPSTGVRTPLGEQRDRLKLAI